MPGKCKATCPACKGPMKTGAKACGRCTEKRGVLCSVCSRYEPGLVDRRCRECWRALEGLETLHRSTCRPADWAWPAGHLEALTARAAAGLPLFG